jgi:hypothetical protein
LLNARFFLLFAFYSARNMLQNEKRGEEMIQIEVNGTKARCVSGGEMLTSGCVGMAVKVAFSPEWRGLIKTAIVCGSGKNLETQVKPKDTFTVPHECMTEAGSEVKIGLYGMRKDGTVVIPTVYCALGTIQEGTVPTGENGEEPTPSVFNQLMAVATEAVDAAQAAQTAAQTARDEAATKADEAASSAETAEKANASAAAQAETATEAAQGAMASEAEAQTAAVDAQASGQAARQYSKSAGDYAAAAEKSASSAKASESTTAASQTAAVKAAAEAQASAAAASQDSAIAAAAVAAVQEAQTAARAGAEQAASSATTATTAADAAQKAKTEAEVGATQAAAMAATATTAADTAVNAAASAATSATSVSESAAKAKASETAAASSAEKASTAATLAAAYKYDPNTYERIDLTEKFADEIAGYSDAWAWIKARIQAGNYTDIHVGDYIPFTTTNSVSLNAQIAGMDTYTGYGDTAVGHHIDFICEKLWPTHHAFNKVNFNNGVSAAVASPWLASDLYHYCNSLSGTVPSSAVVGGGDGEAVDYTTDGIYYYLPDTLKAVIIQKQMLLPKRYSASGLLSNDNSSTWANAGYLWLPTEWEIYGGTIWGNSGYGSGSTAVQYPLFAHSMRRVKKRTGNRDNWWLLSAHSGVSTHFAMVSYIGEAARNDASADIAAPVCFRVG